MQSIEDHLGWTGKHLRIQGFCNAEEGCLTTGMAAKGTLSALLCPPRDRDGYAVPKRLACHKKVNANENAIVETKVNFKRSSFQLLHCPCPAFAWWAARNRQEAAGAAIQMPHATACEPGARPASSSRRWARST